MILVGYHAESTNYRLYDTKTRKIVISRNVRINKNVEKHREDRIIEDDKSSSDLKLPTIQMDKDQETKNEEGKAAALQNESQANKAEDKPALAKETRVL